MSIFGENKRESDKPNQLGEMHDKRMRFLFGPTTQQLYKGLPKKFRKQTPPQKILVKSIIYAVVYAILGFLIIYVFIIVLGTNSSKHNADNRIYIIPFGLGIGFIVTSFYCICIFIYRCKRWYKYQQIIHERKTAHSA